MLIIEALLITAVLYIVVRIVRRMVRDVKAVKQERVDSWRAAGEKHGKDCWKAQVTDDELEGKLEWELSHDWEFARKTGEEMEQLLRNTLHIEDEQEIGVICAVNNLRYLLAKEGKLPKTDAVFGIKAPAVTSKYDQRAVRNWENTYTFVKWMDEELRRHGVKAKLTFQYDSDLFGARPVSNPPTLSQGYFVWDVMTTKKYVELVDKYGEELHNAPQNIDELWSDAKQQAAEKKYREEHPPQKTKWYDVELPIYVWVIILLVAPILFLLILNALFY